MSSKIKAKKQIKVNNDLVQKTFSFEKEAYILNKHGLSKNWQETDSDITVGSDLIIARGDVEVELSKHSNEALGNIKVKPMSPKKSVLINEKSPKKLAPVIVNEDQLISPRRLLPIVDDLEDGEETEEEEEFHIEKDGGASSGRWSTLSWTSLYERGSESSLSWADDELERDATEKVQSIFNKIDLELYMDEESSSLNSRLDPFSMSRLPKEVKEECDIWRNRFPHLRIIGRSISKHPQTIEKSKPSVPNSTNKKEQDKYIGSVKYRSRETKTKGRALISKQETATKSKAATSSSQVRRVTSSASSLISVLTLNDDGDDDPDEEQEEIFASHGTYRDLERGYGPGGSFLAQDFESDWVLSDKFEADPKKYLEDKLMESLFKKIWCSVSPALQQVVDRFAFHVIEQNSEQEIEHGNNFWSFENMSAPYLSGYRMPGLPFQFDSIDENSILTGSPDQLKDDFGQSQYFPPRVTLSLPVSDLYPVSLPNLRPVPASAPLVRGLSVRPTSSQTDTQSPLSRWKRSNSFRTNNNNNHVVSNNKMTTTARAITALGTFNQQGRGPLRNSSTYEDNNKTTSQSSVVRRMRSKSGSPPSRPPTVGSARSQPISLPPIFGTSSSTFNPTSSQSIFGTLSSPYHPASASTSGYSSLTAPITRLGSSTLSTPRSLRLDSGKATPTTMSRPMTSDMSISGVRLKKIDTTFVGTEVQNKGRISSGHSAAHWDAKTTLTPSHAKPRFRY